MPKHAPGGTEDFIGVLFGQDQLRWVDSDVVLGIFGILHRAQNRIGTATQHHVEGAAAAVHLVSQGEGGKARRAEQLGQQDAGDELAG